jgi:hypothetical protein
MSKGDPLSQLFHYVVPYSGKLVQCWPGFIFDCW